jgi:hypothetical protein
MTSGGSALFLDDEMTMREKVIWMARKEGLQQRCRLCILPGVQLDLQASSARYCATLKHCATRKTPSASERTYNGKAERANGSKDYSSGEGRTDFHHHGVRAGESGGG